MPEEKWTVDEAVAIAKQRHQAGDLAEAERIYRQILAGTPEHAESIHFLGVLALQRGDPSAAVELISRADRIRPDNGGYLSNLGMALIALERLPEAVEVLRRATLARPDLPTAFANLGAAYKQLGMFDEAKEAFERALALNPRQADAWHGLGGILFETGSALRAIEFLGRALALNPGLTMIDSARIFMMHAEPSYTAAAILHEARAWEQRHGWKGTPPPFSNARDPDKRLRIGYVSGDLREHSVGRFMRPLLANHDRQQMELFCYSNAEKPDQRSRQLQSASDHWREIAPLSDDAAAEMIRADGIDVLVDLSMHSAYNRLAVFTRQPAPVQATYLAYCGTTGLAAMDYRLSDAVIDPPGMDESVYSEKTLRLPGCYWCYEPSAQAGEVGTLAADRNGQVTFGSLNNFYKANESVLAAWEEILREVPSSRLILSCPRGGHRQRVVQRFGKRVEFAERVSMQEYFALLRRIDIALDTFPYGGGTITCDALWMGVPVVAVAGKTGVGRGSASILTSIGAMELIATDTPEYVKKAVELAKDSLRMRVYRGHLREKMKASPLMDAPAFVSGLEAAYRTMWRSWCAP